MPENRFESLLQSIKDSRIPIGDIEQDAVRDLIFVADLIWGYDPGRDWMPLFYGRELLAEIAAGRDLEFGHKMCLAIELDATSDEPERLAGLVQALKSDCCYRPVDLGGAGEPLP